MLGTGFYVRSFQFAAAFLGSCTETRGYVICQVDIKIPVEQGMNAPLPDGEGIYHVGVAGRIRLV